MVARVRLVEGHARDRVQRPAGEVVRVEVVDAGARAVLGGGVVEGGRHVGLAEGLDRAHLAVLAGEPTEPRGRGLPAPQHLILDDLHEGLGRRRRVVAARHVRGDRLVRRGEAQLGRDLEPLRLDRLEARDAQLVDVARVERERRPSQDLGLVHRVAVRAARTGRSSRWRGGGTRAGPRGTARRRGSRTSPTTAANRARVSASSSRAASAGEASAGSARSRSTCARARSATTRGDVTPAAMPSRATSATASRYAGMARRRAS